MISLIGGRLLLVYKTQDNSTRPRHIDSKPATMLDLYGLTSGDILQQDRAPLVQLMVERVASEGDAGNSIATVRNQALRSHVLDCRRLLAIELELKRLDWALLRVFIRRRRVIVRSHLDHREFRQPAV